MSEIEINIDDIRFTESGIIADDVKGKKIRLLSYIHILGYKKDKQSPISVVCLEYGIFAEGKTRELAIKNLIVLVKSFLLENEKSTVDEFLEMNTKITAHFWALYRKYEKIQLNKVSIDIPKMKAMNTKNKESIEELKNTNKKLGEKLHFTQQILEVIMQENIKLKKEISVISKNHIFNNNAIFIEDSLFQTTKLPHTHYV